MGTDRSRHPSGREKSFLGIARAIADLAERARTKKLKPEEVAKSYAFFRDGEFFEPTGNVSKAKLRTVTKVLQDLGDLPGNIDLDKMFLAGVTKVVD